MTAPARSTHPRPLLLIGLLAVIGVVIASLGVAPEKVTARELLGDPRGPGEAAFVASHRGGAHIAPENTLAAVTATLDAGIDYVEVDLALTADGHAVLMHDTTVDRTTDGTGALRALTLDEVRRLDAGASFDPRFAGTPVPTSTEFFDLLAQRDARAILDLKGEWDAVAAASLVADLAARGLESHVAVASFDARVLAAVAAESELVSRLALLRRVPGDVVEATRAVGALGVVVSYAALERRPEMVAEMHAAGLRVVVYTLNDDRAWRSATDLGVDGIVTDDPLMLADWGGPVA